MKEATCRKIVMMVAFATTPSSPGYSDEYSIFSHLRHRTTRGSASGVGGLFCFNARRCPTGAQAARYSSYLCRAPNRRLIRPYPDMFLIAKQLGHERFHTSVHSSRSNSAGSVLLCGRSKNDGLDNSTGLDLLLYHCRSKNTTTA